MENFPSRRKAHEWLRAQGYKVSQGKIYSDAAKGLLYQQPDGSVLMESVTRYIQLAGLVKPGAESAEVAPKVNQKLAEEIRQLQLKNERLQHENDVMHGRYILKNDHEAELVDLAALLDAVPRHVLRRNLPTYLSSIDADPSRANDFYGMFDRDLTTEINAICDAGEVELVPEGSDAD